MEFLENSFEEFVQTFRSDELYGHDPHTVLKWIIANHDKETIYMKSSIEERAKEIAEQIWPDPLAREAAETLFNSLKSQSEKDPKGFLSDYDRIRLWISTIELSASGCNLSDETLQQILGNIPAYKYDDSRVERLIEYIRYIDMKPLKEKAIHNASCIIR